VTNVKLSVEDRGFEVRLYDCESAVALCECLPLKISMSRWGDEYYGSLGDGLDVKDAADARDVMEVGELAYWLPGSALCIFFGRTPASQGDEPRAASNVNPVGIIEGDASALKELGPSVSVGLAELESS